MTHKKRQINICRSIKKSLLNGWTVPLSSDGYLNYGTGNILHNDGYGAHGFSNPNAWCILNNVINNQIYQFSIQTDGYMGLRIKFSKIGFNSGTDNLIQTPSATDEQIVMGGGTDAIPTYQQITGGMINFNKNSATIFLDTGSNKINLSLQPPIPTSIPNQIPVINKILK